MAENQKPEKSNSMPKSTDINVGGNVDGNIVVGNNNVITYYAAVEANTEKHEPDYWALKHPYPMPPNFTGRISERALLTHWLKEDSENRLFILRALGGFGKSALSWQWLTHDVKPEDFPKVLWWSFYEGDASFEPFIEETLKYLKLEVPQGQRPQVDALLKAMQGQKILLIMDGFERALRAYSSMNAAYQGDDSPLPSGEGQGEGALDCVNINAEIFLKSLCSLPNIKSKVLMTTRLTPRAVKPRGEFMLGCREVELTSMQPADAVEFFHKQKIKGTHAEIEAACAPYGYHPLSLRLLAGRILKDFENPADIVVAQKLKIDGDLIAQKHHILEVSYNSLPSHEQKLLSTIACFRSPVEHSTLESISENKDALDYDLHDLVERGLLHFDEKNKKFDLHPIVRRYTYERLTVPDRTAAHTLLSDYFAAVDIPAKLQSLDDLAPVIELYHHMVMAKRFDEAFRLFYTRLNEQLFYQFAAYQVFIELLLASFNEKTQLPNLKDEGWQGKVLNDIANVYSLNGQPRMAVPLFQGYISISEKRSDKTNTAIGLSNIAVFVQHPIGALRDAEKNLRRAIALDKEINSESDESIDKLELGRILAYRGAWQEAEKELLTCKSIFDKYGVSRTNYISVVRAYLSQLFIFTSRFDDAVSYANEALNLATSPNRSQYGGMRDVFRAYWLLGAAYHANSELKRAEENLSEAITICRQINSVDAEANILLDLARLRYDQKKYQEAKSLADEALTITERCSYVLQGADVNLFLAQYALEQEKDKAKAKAYAEEARKLATCDGPPYYYKVAYEEAERFLANLK